MSQGGIFPEIPGYRILRELGAGAAGQVYLAEGEAGPVAVKVLEVDLQSAAASRARFEREAELLRKAPHPCIVPLLASDLEANPPFLVFPYMEGGDLEGVRLPPGELRALGARLARALAHLHERGILHRDLKPGNLLRDSRGEVHLADLGLGAAREGPSLTATGWIVGTPEYMAPEVLAGEHASPASDVYSLAAVLVELGTGVRPKPVTQGAPLRPEDLESLGDPELGRVLRRALNPEPEDRTPDGAAFGEDLETAEAAPEGPEATRTQTVSMGSARLPREVTEPRGARPGPGGTRWLAGGVSLALGLMLGAWSRGGGGLDFRPAGAVAWEVPTDPGTEVIASCPGTGDEAWVLLRLEAEELRLVRHRRGAPTPFWTRSLHYGEAAHRGAVRLRRSARAIELVLEGDTVPRRFVWTHDGALLVSPDRPGA